MRTISAGEFISYAAWESAARQLFSRRQKSQKRTKPWSLWLTATAVLPLRIINALTIVEINQQTKIVREIAARWNDKWKSKISSFLEGLINL